MSRCRQEFCPNWMGDHLCPCAALDGDPEAIADMAEFMSGYCDDCGGLLDGSTCEDCGGQR